MYRKVKDLTWKNKGQATKTIMSKQGALLTEPEEINQRWKEYIEELYNKAEKPDEIELEEETDLDRDHLGPEILDSEIMQAIKDLKNGQSRGRRQHPC
eukprot:gene13667-15097_t